jgi:hypothetical protein
MYAAVEDLFQFVQLTVKTRKTNNFIKSRTIKILAFFFFCDFLRSTVVSSTDERDADRAIGRVAYPSVSSGQWSRICSVGTVSVWSDQRRCQRSPDVSRGSQSHSQCGEEDELHRQNV